MKCIAFLLTVYFIETSQTKHVGLSLTPICRIKWSDISMPCAYFKERSLDKLFEDLIWTEKSISRITKGTEYTNITLEFTRNQKIEIASLLVLVRYNKTPNNIQQSWEIQLFTTGIPDREINVTIALAPRPDNDSKYLMRRIVNPVRHLDENVCNTNDTKQECNNLINAMLYMRRSWGNSLRLAMASQLSKTPLEVEIMSGHCNITCSGEINNCSGVEIRNMKWEDPSVSLKIHNDNNHTSPVYYCARIWPARHDCCIIYTETVPFDPETQTEISVTFSQKIYLPECFMVLSISLALLVSAMFTIRKMFGASNYRCWPYYTIGSQESVEDGLLNCIQEDSSPARPSETPPLQQEPQNVEVLLIYHNDSDVTEKAMTKFRNILSFYVSKVWDPLDENSIETVSEDPVSWIENVLSRDQVKVILVEDKHTVEWYEKRLDNKRSYQYHHLDNLFLYTLSVLHNNPHFCFNYQRLFIVRYSSSKINIKSTNIVPCTRYEMPQNLSSLITDLVGPYEQRNNRSVQPPLQEIQEFEKLANEFLQSKTEFIEYKL